LFISLVTALLVVGAVASLASVRQTKWTTRRWGGAVGLGSAAIVQVLVVLFANPGWFTLLTLVWSCSIFVFVHVYDRTTTSSFESIQHTRSD
jgi:hypothetical protein